MDFENSIQPLLNCFYYLGQSPFRCKNQMGQNKFNIKKNIFVLTHGILSSLLTFSIIILLNFVCDKDWSRTDRVLINLNAICETIRNIFFLVQCIFSKSNLANVNLTFRMLERFYAIYFGHSILYRTFQRQYKIKAAMIFVVFIPQFIMFIKRSTSHGIAGLALQSKCLQIVKLISILHNILYIDLLNFYFTEFNSVIRKDLINKIKYKNATILSKTSQVNLICERLRYYKIVHFHLWIVAREISDFFGWSLVATVFYIFIEFIHATYFFILRIHPPWIIMHIFR